MKRLFRVAINEPGLLVGLALVGLLIVSIIAPALLVGLDGEAMSFDGIQAPPSALHPFGTDNLGRDILARTLLGGQSTLALAAVATIVGVGLGAIIGMIAGYKGGLIDDALMRTGDAIMALPSLILSMLVLVALGSGPLAIILAIVIIFAPRAARITRSAALNVVSLDFVAAASVVGESEVNVIFREILPNIWPTILVEACLRFSYAILLISALGYLGIGVQPPTPDWGLMIAEGAAFISVAPWMVLFPAIGIVVAVISVNLIGDGLQDLIGSQQRRGVSHV